MTRAEEPHEKPHPDGVGLEHHREVRRIIKGMAVLHITEAELARDVHGVLEKVRGGAEVVIEQNNRPVAVIKPPLVKGRRMSEVIAAMKASGANATVDEDFARDVEEGIKLHREPWTPPS